MSELNTADPKLQKAAVNSTGKIGWIYELRALGILAVVVCHQQYLLHTSETIQMLTLYSVTTLIFLMGITQALWLNRHGKSCGRNVFSFVLKKTGPIISLYVIASAMYLIFVNGALAGSNQYTVLVDSLLSFSAAGPLYFIEYYIGLTAISPVIYGFIKAASRKKGNVALSLCLAICAIAFVIGYKTVDYVHLLGGTYLGIYAVGIWWGYHNAEIKNRPVMLVCGVVLISVGLYCTNKAYMNWVAGLYDPIGFDRIIPKVRMNPPNLSIMVYSAGVILVFSTLFEWLGKRENKCLHLVNAALSTVGKYSLDIFVWHMLIRDMLKRYVPIDTIWIRRIVYYGAMIGLPIMTRMLFEKMKRFIQMQIASE